MKAPLLRLSLLAAATGCINLKQMPPDQPCKEAGFSIASRIFDCTSDGELANATYERFEEEYACILWDLDEEPDPYGSNVEKDLFHCSLVIGAMECDQVLACGDDLDCFLATSPTCALVVTYADGSALSSNDDDTGSSR